MEKNIEYAECESGFGKNFLMINEKLDKEIIEIKRLHHQLAVLQRKKPSPIYTPKKKKRK